MHSEEVAAAEFGQAVRRWRDRVDPETVGLPAGGRRRTAGLRREELALLAGISVDYVVRLEQGRATHPSGQVVAALARVLRVSATERDDGWNRRPASRCASALLVIWTGSCRRPG